MWFWPPCVNIAPPYLNISPLVGQLTSLKLFNVNAITKPTSCSRCKALHGQRKQGWITSTYFAITSDVRKSIDVTLYGKFGNSFLLSTFRQVCPQCNVELIFIASECCLFWMQFDETNSPQIICRHLGKAKIQHDYFPRKYNCCWLKRRSGIWCLCSVIQFWNEVTHIISQWIKATFQTYI